MYLKLVVSLVLFLVLALPLVMCGRRKPTPTPPKTCLDHGDCKGNVAANKKASQWPVSNLAWPASNAVDGNIDSSLSGGSCVEITIQKDQTWWRVDLGGIFVIEKVVVYNRLDKYSDRMDNFIVRIYDKHSKQNSTNDVCGRGGNMQGRQFAEIKCDVWKIGRYVQIELPNKGVMNFCEVQVFQPKIVDVCGRRGIKKNHVIQARRKNNRVVNGNSARYGDWPWAASLQFTGKHFCGATIIDTKWAVTAAQCLTMYEEHKTYGKFTLVAGMNKLSNAQNRSQTFEFEKVIIHPDFKITNANMASDIALIKLNKYVRMSPKLNLACMPDEHAAPSHGENCVFLGWGSSVFPKPTTDDLQQSKVPIVSSSKCTPASEKQARDVICAGYEHSRGAACQFDAGGPLLCERSGRWIVQGVVSFSMRHCDSYTGFTPVNKYRQWIDDTIKLN